MLLFYFLKPWAKLELIIIKISLLFCNGLIILAQISVLKLKAEWFPFMVLSNVKHNTVYSYSWQMHLFS